MRDGDLPVTVICGLCGGAGCPDCDGKGELPADLDWFAQLDDGAWNRLEREVFGDRASRPDGRVDGVDRGVA